MAMKPNWSASAAYFVLENITGPEPVQKCRTTTIAGRAATVVGTYSNICRPLGLFPKFVTCCSVDVRAETGLTLTATAPTMRRPTAARVPRTAVVLERITSLSPSTRLTGGGAGVRKLSEQSRKLRHILGPPFRTVKPHSW